MLLQPSKLTPIFSQMPHLEQRKLPKPIRKIARTLLSLTTLLGPIALPPAKAVTLSDLPYEILQDEIFKIHRLMRKEKNKIIVDATSEEFKKIVVTFARTRFKCHTS